MMLKTSKNLVNAEKIEKILMDIVKRSYEEVKNEDILLCLECCDVDLEIATSNHFEFQEALKENFECDDFGEIIDYEGYQKIMNELFDYFIELHTKSGCFDFFPEGEYMVNGKKVISNSDMIAPKGKFYAPFEEALL